ncbi:MAG TPA: NAD(P)-dependent oxidoreductase [Nitrososphaeraceae archaeon]|nr:NAD(P)-dependent oxidoreductase [Nitrososphaeraceae archaeon]
MRVGIIGLGMMGSHMAIRLLNTGHKISVYNRDIAKAMPFAKTSSSVLKTPRDIALNCDFILICVTNFDAVKEVCFGKNGIVKADRKELIIADSSTISPEQSKYCAEGLGQKDIDFIGMPVMGGPAAAEKGELVNIVAGPKKAFLKVKPIIDKLAKSVFYIGEDAGSANIVKLALNLNIALIAGALSEGITLVKAAGIDPETFIKIINSTYFRTGLSENKGPRMIKDDFQPSFHLKNMLKDLELSISTSQSVGVSLPLTSLTQQMYRAANNMGYSDLDYSAISAFMATINGIDTKK